MNALLVEYNVCDYENFILPKSLHLCMIRFVDNTSIGGGDGTSIGGDELQQGEKHALISNISKCAREEREAGAPRQ